MNSEQVLAQLQHDYGTAQFNDNWIAQDWNYWDMVGYQGSAGPVPAFNYFSQTAGAVDPQLGVTKTTEQTNIVVPNQIGGAECFVCTAIRTHILIAAKARQLGTGVSSQTTFSAWQRAASRLVNAIMASGVATWTINQKQYSIQSPAFQVFPAGFGLGEITPPFSVAADGTAVFGGTNAIVRPSIFDIDGGMRGDTFSLGQPVFLAPNTQFQFQIAFPLSGAAPSAVNIYGASNDQTATIWTMVMLCGQKVRPRG
jgi:hypothetical protein